MKDADATADDHEPSAEELNRIEQESGLLAAEMALLESELRIMASEQGPSGADWQQLRRAIRALLRESAGFHTEQSGYPDTFHEDATSEGEDA